MPYNNAPITPVEDVTGTSALPLARVKKIIAMDEDIAQCSNSAAFAISVATEIFIRYLTEQAHNVVKSERKPRRNIAYKDIATAVSRIDNLEFLADVVPKTKTYRQFREEKANEEAATGAGHAEASSSRNGVNGDSSSRTIDQMMQQRPPSRHEPQSNGTSHPDASVHGDFLQRSPIADRTFSHSAHGHPDPARDLDMTDQ